MNEIDRIYSNFCSSPYIHTVLNAKEVGELLKISGGYVVCYGLMRNIVVDKVTDNCFKVRTEKGV